MKFTLQNYNEFSGRYGVRWHDYFAFMINEFPVILVRKYDWPHDPDYRYTFMIQLLGFDVYQRIGRE